MPLQVGSLSRARFAVTFGEWRVRCLQMPKGPAKVSAIAQVAARRAPRSIAEAEPLTFRPAEFRRRLSTWYQTHARDLPWRGIDDPYATWLSEIMLQQTRVNAVLERYVEFLERFPSIRHLAEADEAEVLSLWSGLGYYRRARMLHRGAQFVAREMDGVLPQTANDLRRLPGIGEYTAAAIASIAFGESVAVLDGNVERVLLRILGQAEDKSSRARARLIAVAQQMMPPAAKASTPVRKPTRKAAPAQGSPADRAACNPAGDHNQAMMELGATICLPRQPLCLQCPVFALCATRGEHVTTERTKLQSRTVAHLLALRKRGIVTEVLLERRAKEASLMAGMLELPPLPLDAVESCEPVLRLRHAITTTNYYVRVYADPERATAAVSDEAPAQRQRSQPRSLLKQVPAAPANLEWIQTTKLAQVPLTGLARKILQRLAVMSLPQIKLG